MIFLPTAGLAQSIYPGSSAMDFAVNVKPEMKAETFPLRSVRLLTGRLRDNLERDSAWMASISVNRLLHSFRNSAGVYAGVEGGYESVPKLGGWESLDCDLRGHTTGHLLSAYALMHAATGADVFKNKGDSLVDGLAQVQTAIGNGYVSAFPEELINRNMRGQSVWAPWYTLHKLLAGLIDQYALEGNRQALDVALRFADWAYDKLKGVPDETRRLMLRNEFGGINEAFYNLYAITGDEKHRWLAEFFHHNEVIDPLYDGEAEFGTRHTNTFIPKVIAEARNYELTGSRKSADAARLFWHSMLHDHCYATGSLSQKEHFFPKGEMGKHINGYTGETCCTYNMLKLGRHLFCWDADVRTADYMERGLYNHILAQQDPESGMVCYFLPLLSGAFKVYSTPEQSFWCCVGSGFESHAKYAESIYFHSPGKLYVNLFAPSKLDWSDAGIALTQHTDFPTSSATSLHIDKAPGREATIAIRHPEWCEAPIIKVNGKTLSYATGPDGYINLTRKWKTGDVISADFPMKLHVEYAVGDSTRGAVMYGPIVLAGDMGAEGIAAPAPFSDPTVRNDYYTYDYHIPANLPTNLTVADLDGITRREGTLEFALPDGRVLRPLYDMHHRRYVVYWDMK